MKPLAHKAERFAAEQKLRRGSVRHHEAEDGLSELGGVAELGAVLFLPRLADRVEETVLIADRAFAPNHGSTCPVGAEGAGAKCRYMHPERRHLAAHDL